VKQPAFSNLDKLFWKKEKITKGDLIAYYAHMAPILLPYLKNRPLVMRRYPNGIHGEAFLQKNVGPSVPSWVKTFTFAHRERKISYILVQNVETLLYVANLAAIELHTFNACVSHIHRPDYLVFDLDPLGVSFDAVVDTALVLHEILEEMKAPHFCKTSGATGLHVYVPLQGKYAIEQVKQIAYELARLAQERAPMLISLERMPEKRRKKVYVDYLQNQTSATMICAYSIRGLPGAPVSTPLLWKEVKHGLDPRAFTLKTVPQRVAKLGDPFHKVLSEKVVSKFSLR